MSIFLNKTERQALRGALTLLQVRKGRAALAVLLGSACLGASLGLAATAAWLIARASERPPVLELSVAVTAVRMFGVSKALLRYVERLTSHEVALEGMAALRLNVYQRLTEAPTSTVAGLRRGDLLARTGADVDAVGDFVVKSLFPALVALVTGLGTVIGIFFLNPQAAAVLALALLLSGIAGPLVTMRAARLAEKAKQAARIELSAGAMTLVDGAAELAVSGRFQTLENNLAACEKDLAQIKDQAARPAAIAAAIDNASLAVAVLGAIFFGIQAVSAQALSPVALAVVVLTPLAAFEGTALLAPAAVQLVTSAGAAVRIMELLNYRKSDNIASTKAPRASLSAATIQEAAEIPTEIILEAKNLSVGWPNGPIVASGINLTLNIDSHLAIVGPSGIGKSTLLFTLAGMLKPKAGTVTINGRDIHLLAREQACSMVTLTAEDAHIFEANVLENLRVANGSIDDEQSLMYLTQAGLSSWISSLPQGLDTVLGSGATTISGGERRRLLLARALCSPAPLLLLDEPGEHIDIATADLLVHDLLAGGQIGISAPTTQQRGVLLVTHRLCALSSADEVIVLGKIENGPARIIARGSHQELSQNNQDYRWALEQERSYV